MKKYFAILAIFLLTATATMLIAACGQKTDKNTANPSGEAIPLNPGKQNIALQICAVNSDCAPKPECHPRECINKKYLADYRKPDVCTQVIYDWAAYTPEDCSCINSQCVNDNLN